MRLHFYGVLPILHKTCRNSVRKPLRKLQRFYQCKNREGLPVSHRSDGNILIMFGVHSHGRPGGNIQDGSVLIDLLQNSVDSSFCAGKEGLIQKACADSLKNTCRDGSRAGGFLICIRIIQNRVP